MVGKFIFKIRYEDADDEDLFLTEVTCCGKADEFAAGRLFVMDIYFSMAITK